MWWRWKVISVVRRNVKNHLLCDDDFSWKYFFRGRRSIPWRWKVISVAPRNVSKGSRCFTRSWLKQVWFAVTIFANPLGLWGPMTRLIFFFRPFRSTGHSMSLTYFTAFRRGVWGWITWTYSKPRKDLIRPCSWYGNFDSILCYFCLHTKLNSCERIFPHFPKRAQHRLPQSLRPKKQTLSLKK